MLVADPDADEDEEEESFLPVTSCSAPTDKLVVNCDVVCVRDDGGGGTPVSKLRFSSPLDPGLDSEATTSE